MLADGSVSLEHTVLASDTSSLITRYGNNIENILIAGYDGSPIERLDAKTLDILLRDKAAQQLCIQALNLSFAGLWEKGYTASFESPLPVPAEHQALAKKAPARIAWLQVATQQEKNHGRVILCERTKGSDKIEVRSLPEILFCWHYRQHSVRLNKPELLVWTLRLLNKAGIYRPKMPARKILTLDAPIEARQVANGLHLLIGLRSGYVPDGQHDQKKYEFSSAPFSQKGFGAAWIGCSFNAVSSGLKWLQEHHIIQRGPNAGQAYTYHFDCNEKATPSGSDTSIKDASKHEARWATFKQSLAKPKPKAAATPPKPTFAETADHLIKAEAQGDQLRGDITYNNARRLVDNPAILAQLIGMNPNDLLGDLDVLNVIMHWQRRLPEPVKH